MVLDSAALDDIHEQLTQEEALIKEMNDYIKEFISANYENVLGSQCIHEWSVAALPYPGRPHRWGYHPCGSPVFQGYSHFGGEFLDKAKENM